MPFFFFFFSSEVVNLNTAKRCLSLRHFANGSRRSKIEFLFNLWVGPEMTDP